MISKKRIYNFLFFALIVFSLLIGMIIKYYNKSFDFVGIIMILGIVLGSYLCYYIDKMLKIEELKKNYIAEDIFTIDDTEELITRTQIAIEDKGVII